MAIRDVNGLTVLVNILRTNHVNCQVCKQLLEYTGVHIAGENYQADYQRKQIFSSLLFCRVKRVLTHVVVRRLKTAGIVLIYLVFLSSFKMNGKCGGDDDDDNYEHSLTG